MRLLSRRGLGLAGVVAVFATAMVATAIWVVGDNDMVTTSSQVGGLRVTMRAPPVVEAGELFVLHFEINDDEGTQEHHTIDFGDRELPAYGTDLVCSGVSGQGPRPEGPTNRGIVERHAYRSAGTYSIRASASTGGCSAKIEHALVEATIRVAPGDTHSNGPQNVRAEIGHEYFVRDPSILVTDVVGIDPDGFVNRLELDWGDGSEPFVKTQSLRACDETRELWPDKSLYDDPRHRYPRKGTYMLRLRVTSVGCDGRNEQVDTTSRQFRYPPEQGS